LVKFESEETDTMSPIPWLEAREEPTVRVRGAPNLTRKKQLKDVINRMTTEPGSGPTVRVLLDAILFVQTATKRMQKMPYLLAEGNTCAGFLCH